MLFVKITRVDVFAISIPLKKPMFMNNRCISMADNILVRIEAESGQVGWGESSSSLKMTGELQSTMKEVIEKVFKPILLDQNIFDYELLTQKINQSIYRNTGAKSAVNTAMLDLLCRWRGMPMNHLLGTPLRNIFRSIQILGNKTWDENISEALALQNNGFNNFKVKVLAENIRDDIQGVIKLREAVGPDAIISADANAGLSMPDSYFYLSSVESAGLQFFEQPMASSYDMSRFQAETNQSLGMDELIFDLDSIKDVKDLKSARGVNLKLMKMAGPLHLIELANASHERELKVNISGKVAETGIATSALLQCAAVSPNIDWGISTTNQYLESDIIKAPLTDAVGNLLLPEGHGLGVEIDEYLLNQFLIKI